MIWNFNELQRTIWEKKYQQHDETQAEWFSRVCGGDEEVMELMKEKKFVFGGRILSNRGLDSKGKKTTMSNCYVLPSPEDNIESIFETAKMMARTYSYGGGVGIDLSNLRPKGMTVNNSAGATSGSTSFMKLYDLTTDLIGQNGRRGALMMSMNASHPDIYDFITIKNDENAVTKANISVKVSDTFMWNAVNDEKYWLRFDSDNGDEFRKEVDAKDIFHSIAENAHKMAEPGLLFWDKIMNHNLLENDEEFIYECVNPCAEIPLQAGGACLLGSINLSEFVVNPFTDKAQFDFNEFERVVKVSVRALNDVLDEGTPLHPLEIQRENADQWRPIGLGYMGIADMFIKMGLAYGSEKSLVFSEMLAHMGFVASVEASALLAKEHGAYPKYKADRVRSSTMYQQSVPTHVDALVKEYGLRNSQLIAIAPTGTISTLIGVSGGIEPLFATHYTRRTQSLHDADVEYKVYSQIIEELMEARGVEDIDELEEVSIVTSHDLSIEHRVAMQSAWQRYVDNAISSTMNLPNEATVEDVEKAYTMSWQAGLKGITVFRAGCEREAILTAG